MNVEALPLMKQVEMVFRELKDELLNLSSGIVFIQIRNNVIGKFGVKHDPFESREGEPFNRQGGLSEAQLMAFRKMAVESLRHKKNWTHGEIRFEFALKRNVLHTSVQFESNYNMANLLKRSVSQ